MIALGGLTFVCLRLQLNISTAAFLYLIVIVLLSLAGDYVSSVVTSVIAAVCFSLLLCSSNFLDPGGRDREYRSDHCISDNLFGDLSFGVGSPHEIGKTAPE